MCICIGVCAHEKVHEKESVWSGEQYVFALLSLRFYGCTICQACESLDVILRDGIDSETEHISTVMLAN